MNAFKLVFFSWLAVMLSAAKKSSSSGSGSGSGSSDSSSSSDDSSCDIHTVLGSKGIEVYGEADSGYADAKWQYGSGLAAYSEDINPNYVAFATDEYDVQDIISFVNGCDEVEYITIRSGGHQYSGRSSCDGDNGGCLQIDVSLIDTWEILDANYINDNDTTGYTSALVRVGTGLSYEVLYQYGAASGLVVLGGVCEDVHIGGNYQSCGHNAFNHALGSGMDYIIGFTIVLADGSIVYVDENNNYANLYWAVRGGSPGAFGVVISYDVQMYYGTNFPYAAVSYTIYKFGNNVNDAAIAQTIGELYSEATGHPSFTDSLDVGSIYGFVTAKNVASDSLQAVLNFFGSSHWFAIIVSYSGIDSNVIFEESSLYKDIVQGLLRNTSRLIESPIFTSDETLPAQFIPLATGSGWDYRVSGFTQMQGSELFSNSVYEKFGEGLDYFVNTKQNDIIGVLQGGVYGGAFVTKDTDMLKTAHPYRDTVSYIELWVRLRNESVSVESEKLDEIQTEVDDLFDDMRDLISEEDRNKRWIAYTHGDMNIKNVWPLYYDNDISFYNKLRCVKYIVDKNNLFNTGFTVPPKNTCDSDSSSSSSSSGSSSSSTKSGSSDKKSSSSSSN